MRVGAAWTLWPGTIHLRDVELRGRSARLDWYASLDSVAASFRIRPLFENTVHLGRVSVSGLDYRQRRRVDPAVGDPDVPETVLPPLPDLIVRAPWPAPPPPVGGARGEPWSIVADDIAADVRQLWFERYRLSGPMQVGTSMKFIVRGPMEFPRVRIGMSRGALVEGERAIFDGFGLDIETGLPPFVPKELKALDVLALLTGRFQIRADRASLLFLESYFRRAPWIRFNGRSPLQADLRLAGGRLQPGSTLVSSPDAVDIDFLDRKLTGRGRVSLNVEATGGGPRSRVEVLLDEFALAEQGRSEPYARGRGFKVTATSAALDLEDPFGTLAVTADLPEAVIPDLSFYNRYIPPGSGLFVRGGTGRIRYHIEGSQDEQSVHGWIDLSADAVAARFLNYDLVGDVKIRTALKRVGPWTGRFDISGTRVDLKSRSLPWTADVVLPKAEIRFTEPVRVRADADIRMTDTTPLVALFDARKDVSHFVEKLMTIRDIRGTTTLSVDDRGFEVTNLEVTGEKFIALADLALRKGGKDGILYLKLHGFSVGVALDNGKKDLDLVRARTWFERRRAGRNPAPVGE